MENNKYLNEEQYQQNAKKLKRIGTYARQDLEQILGIKVNLKLWVKVSKDWQEKDNIVKRFKLK